MSTPRILMVDHRDSFVFILADQFRSLGADVHVYRVAETVDQFHSQIRKVAPQLIVLSPGPGRPENAGATVAWLATRPEIPVLGVCLGHQALVAAAGGTIRRAVTPVHGRPWPIRLLPDPLFDGLPSRFIAARYHSLVVDDLPADFSVIATALDGKQEQIMAIRHRRLPQIGLQFHPESVLTPLGKTLLGRVLVEGGVS